MCHLICVVRKTKEFFWYYQIPYSELSVYGSRYRKCDRSKIDKLSLRLAKVGVQYLFFAFFHVPVIQARPGFVRAGARSILPFTSVYLSALRSSSVHSIIPLRSGRKTSSNTKPEIGRTIVIRTPPPPLPPWSCFPAGLPSFVPLVGQSVSLRSVLLYAPGFARPDPAQFAGAGRHLLSWIL
jgi:hypothetical protein